MRYFKNIVASVSVMGFLFAGGIAFAGPSKVTVTGKLEKRISDLNRIEKRHEKEFRKYRQNRPINIKETAKRRSQLGRVQWAGERLVPDLEDFSFQNFSAAIADESLKKAGLSDNGKSYVFEVSKLKITNHSLVALNSVNTYAKGRIIEIDDSTGQELRSEEITAQVFLRHSIDWNYDGPDFAFNQHDKHSRFGPVMVNFISKALEKLHPDAKFPRAISIVYNRL